jgi:hypothetical protein
VNYKLITNLHFRASVAFFSAVDYARHHAGYPRYLHFRTVPGLPCAHRVRDMERKEPHILLCFGCRRRITVADLHAGHHDHVDAEERREYDLAVNNGND